MGVVYGPVLSWRFGSSLGIDLISGSKVCTFDCIYCQLGRTVLKVSKPGDFRNYVKAEKVVKELEDFINKIDFNSVDVVTFSGSGEPTLNPELGKIVEHVKDIVGEKPLVILTNSSLFYLRKVREALSKIDIVSAKLDAGDEKAFEIINRSYLEKLSINKVIGYIKEFKSIYDGKLMIQTMFLNTTLGFTNSEGEHFEKLIDAYLKIEPDVIQVDTPYRPGGEKFVKPVSIEKLKNIGDVLANYFPRDNIWVFGLHDKSRKKIVWKRKEHKSIILDTLKRRPLRLVDIANLLNVSSEEAYKIVEQLKKDELIKEKILQGEVYYIIAHFH